MQPLPSHEIRQRFLKFFEQRDHQLIPGASVVPKDDPSLLYINAGMAPLKPYFLGHKKPSCPRLVNVQPCIRTNDIADVGDRHHLTMFEMMGNWSIGDYFKEKAVELAYELLVHQLGFDPQRLFATVYEGNPELGLEPDTVSQRAWQKVGIPDERIVMLGADNFWSAGDTGPCGPCTEVFYDTGEAFGPAYVAGGEFDTTKRYIEIWNAGVFMELNKRADGSYEPLPFKSVDTGSGVERMTMVMNNCATVYETDLFQPLMQKSKALFPNLKETDYRIISDHIRAVCFITAAGVQPSNEGQGYIPRRLIRKAVAASYRSGSSAEGLLEMVSQVQDLLGPYYSDLIKNPRLLSRTIQEEIQEFEPVIKNGIKIFDSKLSELKTKHIPGPLAFQMVATYGLPLEIIRSLASERGYSLDQKEYDQAFKQHQDTSRVLSGAQKFHGKEGDQLLEQTKDLAETVFNGYNQLQGDAKILFLSSGSAASQTLTKGAEGLMITDQTVFYAESGGQVGDTGHFTTENAKGIVTDTQKQDGRFMHKIQVTEGQLKVSDSIHLEVTADHRHKSACNHSATHLLHSALKQVLGDHVSQKGSYVEPNRLRFDFTHKSALSPEELIAVETQVNEWIWANLSQSTQVMSLEDAMASGAEALFSETYGDKVRVVTFGKASVELCGGTHVPQTGAIGLFAISAETSIAKGVRRIEAVTGTAALQDYQQTRQHLRTACEALGVKAPQIPDTVKKLRKQAKAAGKQSQSSGGRFDVVHKHSHQDQVWAVVTTDLDRKALTHQVQECFKSQGFTGIIAVSQQKSYGVFVFVQPDFINEQNSAHKIVQALTNLYAGRGGGKPGFAQGGFAADQALENVVTNFGQELERYFLA